MNGRHEELLSAYLDGELTDDERARVEQWLADELGAREALDELAEVSGWIRALPRPAAPVDLHSGVLARVRTVVTPAPALSSPRRPAWRRRAAWLGSAAALLLVAFTLLRSRQLPQAVDPTQASREMSVAHVESFGAVAGIGRERSPDFDADGLTAAAPARPALGSEGVVEEEGESLARTAEHEALTAFINSDLIQNEFREQLELGEPPAPGDVLSDVSQVGDQLVVTQYRVVDTQNVLGQIQVILTKNGIEALPPSSTDQGLLDAQFGDSPSNGRLQAIYVDAPSVNFQSAVDAIAGLENVTGVTTNTLLVEEFEHSRDRQSLDERTAAGEPERRALQERLAASDAAVAGSELNANGVAALPLTAAKSAEAAPAPETPALAPLAPFEAVELETPPPPPRSLRTNELADALDPGADGYQVIVPARPELLAELQRKSQFLFFGVAPPATAAAPADHRFNKQVQRRNWNFPAPTVENQTAAPDRTRAVILLVPQESP